MPVTPAFTGVIDTRQVPGVARRIVQVATRELVAFCVATEQAPRAIRAACACFRAPDVRVALMRYVVPAPAANAATSGRVVRRDFDHRTWAGVGGGTPASFDAGAVPGAVGVVGATGAEGVTAVDAPEGWDDPYVFDAVAVNV